MKRYLSFCLILTFLVLCGCSNYKNVETTNKTTIEGVSSVTENTSNDYFYSDDVVLLRAEAKYSSEWPPYETKKISAKMYKIKTYGNGTVFRLSIEPVGVLSTERLNIYFYVTKDKIYRLWSHFFAGDKVITFYDNDELLVSTLDTDEKLIENGEIVCQLEERSVEDDVAKNHYSVVREGNKITYSRVDSSPNGEPYYSEYFIWELHKGLIEYGSSFKAEAELLELINISKANNN